MTCLTEVRSHHSFDDCMFLRAKRRWLCTISIKIDLRCLLRFLSSICIAQIDNQLTMSRITMFKVLCAHFLHPNQYVFCTQCSARIVYCLNSGLLDSSPLALGYLKIWIIILVSAFRTNQRGKVRRSGIGLVCWPFRRKAIVISKSWSNILLTSGKPHLTNCHSNQSSDILCLRLSFLIVSGGNDVTYALWEKGLMSLLYINKLL